jgi:signal transduction histidine kinase
LVFSLHPENPSNYLKLEKDFAEVLPKDLSPRSIIVDQENNIWIGTRYKGVFKFTISNNSIKSYKQFTTHEGLSDNFIYNLRCDQKNTIWLGTQSGLDKIFLKEGKYITGNVSKGHNFFQSVMMLETTIHNTTWALTSGGTIIKVDTTSISKMLGPPPLLLSAMFINNEEYNGSSNRFSYKKNNLLFQVSSASFVDEHAIRYSYLLEGSGNDSWSKPSSNATLNFNNLSSGNYTLHVRSDFPEAIYRSQTLSYSFTILPPWWSSWWFLSLVGILILFSLTMILRNYYRRKLEKKTIVLERQQAIEKERTRIATDMHDDLGAGLSTIRFLREKVKRNSFSDVTKSDAEKIVFNSNELVQKMNEIIWAMNEKNDTLEDLLFYTRSYAVEYCEENEIACEISLPENIPSQFVSGEIRRNVFLTVKESLHNIVKHSGAKNVKIVFEIDRHLCASISDDGQGMAIKEGMGGNGLRNMRKRVESVNGKFEIRNNKGVTIQIEIPLTV